MSKIARKVYLDEKLVQIIDQLSAFYNISKSNLIEDLLVSRLYPARSTSIRIRLIEQDDYYNDLIKAFEGCDF